MSQSTVVTNNAPAVYLFFPETSGRHLEEVDQIFRDSNNIFQPVKVAKQLPMRELAHDEEAEKAHMSKFESVGDGKEIKS